MDLAAHVAAAIFVVVLVIGQNVMARLAKVPTDTVAKDPGASKLYRVLGAIPLSIYLIGGGWSFDWVPDEVRVEGFIFIAMGLALIFWAQLSLGRNWVGGVGLHDSHTLITSGPYAWVRHPLYSGFCLAAVGIALASANPLAASGALLVALSLLVRIWGEEELLKRRFKKEYLEYRSRTGYLIPRLRQRL